MKNHDVVLLSFNAGGSGSTNSYSFLIINPDQTTKMVSDDDLQSEDGTFEVRKQGETIEIDFGYSGGLARRAKLVGTTLTVSSKKTSKVVPLSAEICEDLFKALKECGETERKEMCDQGTWVLSNATRGSFKVASQKPGFDAQGYNALCTQACATGEWPDKKTFRNSFCGSK